MNLALFDLDHTLINGDSDVEWTRFMISRGLLDGDHHNRTNDAFYQDYLDGTLDIQAYLAFQVAPLARYDRATLDRLHREFMAERIFPVIPRKARERIAEHKAAGDLLMIITATNRFVTAPIARELGVDNLIAIELEEDGEGKFTGRPSGVPSYREGKVTRLMAWLAERGETLDSYGKSYFYSDSRNDIPLLSKVTDPVAVNPDDTLRAHALAHGWPVISLRD
ncbi:HAD family hydrolase [Paludibacterium paludis]|uniref:Histidinol-phosphatase n=1 Tax=Paludibacterium paludis TaxID=1225769 RepID=A0A918P6U8_9NEIS|nr:HAD family hydrolase [Paludibacterium paludis]GGY27172.1 haloacid dehalogenase [Paludibacterium paludis]